MKILPMPNFGSFGAIVDDVDMDNMTEEQWHEIGQLFIDRLVVVLRNVNMSRSQYLDWIPKWGASKSSMRAHLINKYGRDIDATNPENLIGLDEQDLAWITTRGHQLEKIEDGRYLVRVYGGKDEQGNLLGYFSSGEVHWHANEGSSLVFSPAVSLLGNSHMVGSATGFVQTVDLYESLSESFRSELDEMVVIHQYEAGRVNDNELTDSELSLHVRMAFCPKDGAQTPLVCTAPNGRRGIHYTLNTQAQIRGMSMEESQKLFAQLDKMILDPKWIYDHYYETDNTLCLFDNSVTMHRRLGGQAERKAYRMQWDVSPLLDKPWRPWQHMPEFDKQYAEEINLLVNTVGGRLKETFKLPELI